MARRRMDGASPQERRRRRLGRRHDQGWRAGAGAGWPLDHGARQKNPKPLDGPAFSTLVKTASEFVRRHEQQLHATLHQRITVTAKSARVTVSLDIVPDEDNPHALLSAHDDSGEQLAQVCVLPSFKPSCASAVAWVENDFRKPAER